MKYMLGCNYWGSDYGTDMWLHYDGAKIRQELKQLYEYGVRCLRVFPNWRDFQPVDRAYAWAGYHGEYFNAYTKEPIYGDGVDLTQIENFRDFCHASEEVGMTLVVSIVTGWMSGRLFNPPVLNGKNLISDPEALMWTKRFVHRFVKELKNEKAIICWDLGNECNCLGKTVSSYEAYMWTSTVVDAIRSEDTSRPISSGMHGLESGGGGNWTIEEQGELCDILTTHPYPSPTVTGDNEPYTRLRMTYLPTAQSLYYSNVGQKPAYIQESGTFSQSIGNKNMSADFMRIQILSSLVHNLLGYQWWCAWEQNHLDYPPYSWSMIERELGLFDKDKNPKPVAFTMQKMASVIDSMPNEFPKRVADGVCILTRAQNRLTTSIACLTLAKQAGLDLDVAYSDNGDIPESKLYFMPSITGWQVIYKKTVDTLIERVKQGATLCVSFVDGHFTDFPEIMGAESNGVMAGIKHTFNLNDKSIEYSGKEILLSPTTATVIASNEDGNPVILKNKLGNGVVYFINANIEGLAINTPDGFNKIPFYTVYEEVAKNVIKNKIIVKNNPNLGITVNPESDNLCIVSVLNYSDKDIVPELKINEAWSIKEILYGSLDNISACDGLILRLTK